VDKKLDEDAHRYPSFFTKMLCICSTTTRHTLAAIGTKENGFAAGEQ